ncbi:hypothetical protein E2C01_027579 [Portunus trituberculatus]|uniref:Uncharacterized protein n=1 Tax=Portunus trituberculatus TaxID=210409 RepID=A0A5B7EM07_PORTR|nr:hypothetical protein [Portunus trituberculatus]
MSPVLPILPGAPWDPSAPHNTWRPCRVFLTRHAGIAGIRGSGRGVGVTDLTSPRILGLPPPFPHPKDGVDEIERKLRKVGHHKTPPCMCYTYHVCSCVQSWSEVR